MDEQKRKDINAMQRFLQASFPPNGATCGDTGLALNAWARLRISLEAGDTPPGGSPPGKKPHPFDRE